MFNISFIGIGATKAGTTWAAKMLAAHPDVCVSEPKEVHFFDTTPRRSGRPIGNNFGKGLSWYQKHFCHCPTHAVTGEFTPAYLTDPAAPANIQRFFPDVKMIVCLRNPIDRAYSGYTHYADYLRLEKRDFFTAIREEPEYVQDGLYCRSLVRYFEHFDRSQFLTVMFEDIRNHPRTVVADLYRFLGVDADFVPAGVTQKTNYAKRSTFPIVGHCVRIAIEILVSLGLSKVIVMLKKAGFNKLVLKAYTRKITRPPMPEAARTYLREAFTDDTRQLEQLLQKDLSHWT